jgi:ribonucleotide monophosphatase NagD (HAD superfamily)
VLASMCGFKSLVVLTGVTSRSHLLSTVSSSHSDKRHVPDYYTSSLADVAILLKEN